MAQTILDALRRDHQDVRKLFARLETASGKQRRELLQRLVAELVRHEVAEEEILRPVSKHDAGEAIANARIKSRSRAARACAGLATKATGSPYSGTGTRR